MATPIRPIVAAILTLTCASAAPQNPVFETKIKERQATVSIMALTAVTHRGFSGNQDTYLADIGFKQGEHELARLVDFYPQAANPIQRSILTDRHTLKMRLTRTPNCDAPYKDLLVATPSANIFDTSIRSTLAAQPDEVVPCFKVNHDATKLAKK
jgi:hypothetical protein